MIKKLTAEEIEALLHGNIVGRIGCCADGTTYIVPISYAYDGQHVYCHTFEGMKMKLMRSNPAVCFEVDELKDVANWKSVIAQGIFEELTNADERRAGLKKLADRVLPLVASQTMYLAQESPFEPEDYNSIPGIVFRIMLKEKTGRFETNSISFSYP
jgi:uncharacterized protein